MWSVVLKILSILGITVLCLLAFLLTAALLVLFWPISYRGKCTASMGEYRVNFRFRWLFGLVRGTYKYPEDGKLRIKALWITVYESGGSEKVEGEETTPPEQFQQENSPREPHSQAKKKTEPPAREILPQEESLAENPPSSQGQEKDKGAQEQTSGEPAAEQKADHRNIREKLLFYVDILRNKDNQELVLYSLGRLGRIITHIRPRYLRARAVAGLGEPDLTGYAYGAYCAIRPFLGKKCQMNVTPDFERRILEGEAVLRGRVMAATVLYHVCSVLFDRRLRQLTDQLRGDSSQMERQVRKTS